MNPFTFLRHFAARLTSPPPPQVRANWLGPRFEPVNISSTATVEAVQTAIRQAESGETTSLFRFYRDSLLGDDHVQGCLNTRKLAVLGQPLAVLPADKLNPDDVLAAAACLRAIEDCDSWSGGLSALLSASQWPVSIVENIYRPADPRPIRWAAPRTKDQGPRTKDQGPDTEDDDTPDPLQEFALRFTLKKLEPVNPMLFCFRHAYLVGGVGLGSATPEMQAGLMGQNPTSPARVGTSAWYSIDLSDWEPFLRLWPIDDAGRIIYDASRAAKLDPTRHIVHRGHLLTEHRDNWGGPMRAILFWWLLRGLGRDWFARFMERYGSPFPVAKTNVQDKEAVSLLETAFSLATKIGGLVIGQDDQVELQQAIVQGGAEGHATWARVCNDAIARHITGYSSSDKPAGLNAGESTAQETVRGDIRQFDSKLLSETLQKQVFPNFLRFNGLTGQIRVMLGGLSTADAATFAGLLKTTAEAGFEPTDDALPAIEEKLGFAIQRKAPPVPLGLPGTEDQGPKTKDQETEEELTESTTDDGEIETLSVRGADGRLRYFSASGTPRRKPPQESPTDGITAARKDALTAAYRGVMAPFREIILSSHSREEALTRLTAAYRDWKPERLASELETALQLCAATGAAHAAGPKKKDQGPRTKD
jgi:phage gp29-like protein